jgi:hypothetical protein
MLVILRNTDVVLKLNIEQDNAFVTGYGIEQLSREEVVRSFMSIQQFYHSSRCFRNMMCIMRTLLSLQGISELSTRVHTVLEKSLNLPNFSFKKFKAHENTGK